MTKKLGIFSIVVFLSMQMFSYLHMAEFAFEKHDHHGQMCSIHLCSDQSKFFHVASTVFSPIKLLNAVQILSLYSQVPQTTINSHNNPRAPPAFLVV